MPDLTPDSTSQAPDAHPTQSLYNSSISATSRLNAGEMNHSLVAGRALFPLEQQACEPVQPAWTALDHASAGAVLRNGPFLVSKTPRGLLEEHSRAGILRLNEAASTSIPLVTKVMAGPAGKLKWKEM